MENSDWEEIGQEAAGPDGKQEGEANQQTLTPKALDLMQKISEYGYLTMPEVQLIYGNKTWAYKVVNGLRSQGFIADHDTMMHPRKAHYLTLTGYRILGKFGRLKVGFRFKPERYSIFIFRHRMACARVGLRLEKHPLVHEFLPESRLFKLQKSKLDKLCDGEFWYRVPGHERPERVGLEVELTLKGRPRLDETFEQLRRRADLDQVWWICADDTIRRGMRREVLRRYIPSQRQLFALLPEFLASKDKAELMEPNGTLLSIDPAKPTLLPRVPEPPPPPTPPPRPAPIQVAEYVARAEAPRPARLVPAEEPAVGHARLLASWLGSSVLRIIEWGWEWLREFWTVHRYGRWGFELYFNRWPHVWAVALLCLGLTGYRHRATLDRVFFPPMPEERRTLAKRKPPKPAPVKHKLGDRCWESHSPLEPDDLVPCETLGRKRPVDGMYDMSASGRIDQYLRRMQEKENSGSAPKQSEPQ